MLRVGRILVKIIPNEIPPFAIRLLHQVRRLLRGAPLAVLYGRDSPSSGPIKRIRKVACAGTPEPPHDQR